MQWKAGDIVRLKSGGPVMTVTDTKLEEPYVQCVWFDAKKTKHTDTFNRNTLEAATKPTGSAKIHRA